MKLKFVFVSTLLASLLGCGKETGKYTTGPDDPARNVTPKDIAQVEDVLKKQEEADIAGGLRSGAPPLTDEQLKATNPHEQPHGHDKTADQARQEQAARGAGEIDLRYVRGTLPEGWEQEPPSSNMRIAQARIPRSAGDGEDGELGVFYFGPDA